MVNDRQKCTTYVYVYVCGAAQRALKIHYALVTAPIWVGVVNCASRQLVSEFNKFTALRGDVPRVVVVFVGERENVCTLADQRV